MKFNRNSAFCGTISGLFLLATSALSVPVQAGTLLSGLANASVAAVDASSFFNGDQWYLNTDNGHIYHQFSNYPWDDKGTAGQIVAQPGGPDAWVWNFSKLSINAKLTIQGSHPAVIQSNGDIAVNAAVVVHAGGLDGGIGGKNNVSNTSNVFDNGSAGTGATGGQGGQGGGHIVSPYTTAWGWTYVFSGGGGGGGFYSAGQNAPIDPPVLPYKYDSNGNLVPNPPAVQYMGGNGGSAYTAYSVLSGGGGGGGGGDGSGYGGGGSTFSPGGNGGSGGGAILFATTGNLTIGSNGSVSVNGQNPAYIGAANTEASGGGGAGGYAAFNIGGALTNDGSVTAQGAYGSYNNGLLHGPATSGMGGAGSGGYVAIDAGIFNNNGAINVSGGSGVSVAALGGQTALNAPLILNSGKVSGQAQPNPINETYPINCIFNGLEKTYANLLQPAGALTEISQPYIYRHYAQTKAYIGFKPSDGHIYYLGPASGNNPYDAGPATNWVASTGCQ